MRPILAPVLLLVSCAGPPEAPDGPASDDAACDPTSDRDGDGLDDCTEAEIGTTADDADSDGDGISDGDEVDCVSDPLDPDEQCYACGWPHNDPGDLAPTGADIGDTVANLALVDQCGETVDLYDFADAYTLAFMTAAWCPMCMDEAAALGETTAIIASETGHPVRGIVLLFEGNSGTTPVPEDAEAYAARIEAGDTPVLGDVSDTALAAVPYDGSSIPGVCLLSPTMEIVACTTEEGNLTSFADVIRDHAG